MQTTKHGNGKENKGGFFSGKAMNSTTNKSVLDRLRLSQKIAEARDSKRRFFLDGKKGVKPDDGDHGLVQGYVKRKGIRQLSSQLEHIMLDSPSRKNVQNRIVEGINSIDMVEEDTLGRNGQHK